MDIIDTVLNLIYPNYCMICEEICKQNICCKCKQLIKKFEKCSVIKKNASFFNEQAYIFKYEGIIRKKIIEYKFMEKPYLYKSFSKLFLENEKICNFINQYEIIIPVPIHKKRKFERGYNQVELIAKEIAQKGKLQFEKRVLFKLKNVLPQSRLKKVQREENVKGAFIVKNPIRIINKKVLLLDDIYTTGSTVNECSKVLKKAGANSVGVLTIAKD